MTAPPVKDTEKNMTMVKVNPKPKGAMGVSRCFSRVRSRVS